MTFISDIVTGAISFTAALSQQATNGASTWGTLSPPFAQPSFLTNNPLPDGYPWGSRTAENSAPDGYQKDVLLINGQFPGPLIEANWGDWIQVTLHNNIDNPKEGTSLHWHGLLQTLTPWYDGTPSVQQCPVAPGSSFTYLFKADLYGSSWYHSHYSSQYAGGLFGPMIIHGPKAIDTGYDFDVGPGMLSDWHHPDYFSIVEDTESTNKALWAVSSDNNLINGKMNFDCTTVNDGVPCVSNAGLSKFNFTTGKTHRLRLINTSAAALQRFSIDEHEMMVIANDFVPINPYNTTVVTLAVGQRADVLVTATGMGTGVYWIRSNISTYALSKNRDAVAAIYYDQASSSVKQSSIAWPYAEDGQCANVRLLLH
ncbi:hypothetical protein MMC12_008100 [Toensbergia leucococca]|nr:hypothetical protein [Toensbergia leucococca]